MNRSTRNLRRSLGVIVAACAGLALSACSGHGRYTTDGQITGRRKLDAIKAATEYQMSHQAFLAGDLEKALKHCDKSLELSNEVPKTYVLRGRILMEMGDLEQALVMYQKAEVLGPKEVDPQYYMGVLFERFSQRDKALEKYKAASALEPANAQYVLAAAEMMMDMGQLAQAKDYLTEQLKTFEHNAGVRQTLGHIAMMQEEFPGAVKHFAEAKLLAPDDGGIQEDLARAQIRVGSYAEADSTLVRLMKSAEAKNRRDLQLLRVQCLVKLERPLDAREILLDITRSQDGANDTEAWVALGNVSFILKDMNRVKVAATRVIAIAPKEPEGYLLKALYLRHAGQLDAAEAAAQHAVTCRQTPEAFTLLGLIQRDAGRTEASQESFASAQRLTNDAAHPSSHPVTQVPEPKD